MIVIYFASWTGGYGNGVGADQERQEAAGCREHHVSGGGRLSACGVRVVRRGGSHRKEPVRQGKDGEVTQDEAACVYVRDFVCVRIIYVSM